MKTFLILLAISLTIFSCGTGNTNIENATGITDNDTIRIVNDSLEYEIIIIEPGFNTWLVSQPPRGYYGQTFLENKNRLFVTEYNSRVRQVGRFPRDLYIQEIDYDPTIDYGYEVNYLLYNYFVYFQERYNQRFIGGRN